MHEIYHVTQMYTLSVGTQLPGQVKSGQEAYTSAQNSGGTVDVPVS